jgi:hypothetical protein
MVLAMSEAERRTGMLDRGLAAFPGWQVGGQPQRRELERRDLLGAIASVELAPLGESELDVLAWVTQQWFDQGQPADGRVKFTWFALGRDLHGGGRRGFKPSGGYRANLRSAVENLHAAVITLRAINVLSGEREDTLRSKVHILEAVVDHQEILKLRLEDADNAALLGALRKDTVEVKLAGWLVDQLLRDAVVLDWRTQRSLAGAAKFLWVQLRAYAHDFTPTAFPGCSELVIDATPDFYAGLDLNAARERDNRGSLVRAAARVVAVDPSFPAIDVLRRPDGYVLRAVRRDQDVEADTARPADVVGLQPLPGFGP